MAKTKVNIMMLASKLRNYLFELSNNMVRSWKEFAEREYINFKSFTEASLWCDLH